MTGVSMGIRFGVIGLRRGQSFVRACRAVGDAEVTAIYDIDEAKAAEVGDEIGATAHVTLESFLASDISAVVIASPLPYHARQAVAALEAGKHVLSEVTACYTMEDARVLVAAAAKSDAIYMMGENYRYLDEVELVKRIHADGRFGDVYFGEGEYIHDCRDLWYDESGELTWRGKGLIGVYCTHSLGPLLYITGDRVKTVSALAVPGGKFDSKVSMATMYLLQMVTEGGATFRVRVDHVSPRPHQMAYYSLQGTKGSYEAWRGNGDTSKIWLEDAYGPSKFHDAPSWHPLSDFAEEYIPDRLAAPAEARTGGHGNSEYWMLKDFQDAVRGKIAPPIDVHRALDYTLPGIVALESAELRGAPLAVPDSRLFELG
jgi:predicted dehydrogenase